MNGGTLILLETLLVLGLVFGFGIWQLVSLRREREKDARDAAESESRADGDRTSTREEP